MSSCLRLITALFFVFSLQASETPRCDSPLVRLSRWPVSCQGKLPSEFDIPALEINFSDIEKIIQGAESSGGRRRPDLQDRPMMPMGIARATHTCTARLLIDSQTRISWLLSRELEIGAWTSQIRPKDWRAGLTTSLNPFADFFPVAVMPKIDLKNVSASVYESELNLCYGSDFCAQTKIQNEAQLILKTLSNGLKLSIALSCREI